MVENEQTQKLRTQVGSQQGCLSQSWLVLVVATAVAFVVVACGATAYMWWHFIGSGNFDASVRSAGTLIAFGQRTVPSVPTAEPTATMTLTATPRRAPSPIASSSATPTRPAKVIRSSVIQRPIRVTEEAGGPSAVPTPRFGPLAADTSTEALSLPPPEAAITVTAASTATVSAATVPAGVATSLLKPSATPPVVRQGVVRATESAIVATAPLPAGSISPPQGRIVFPAYSAARKNWDLYIADTKGGGRTLVREQASLPAFAPGFSQLAFRSLHPSFLGLGLLQMGSSDFVQLTRYAEDARPSWSRDVPTLLVFDSQRQSDRRWRLYGVVADATTEWEMAVDNKPVYGQFPAWVPGGRLIYSGCVNGQCGLILADGDGSSPRAITSSPNDTAPVVSPDGQWVAFLSYDRPNGDLYATNMATGVKVALVQSDSNVGAPAWSPDGRYIGFVSNRGGQTAVWAVPFQGEQSQVLVPIKLFDLTELPPEGWPWLAQGIAWGQ